MFPAMSMNVSVNMSDSINLTCQARGSPPPVFSWYFNGDRIADLTIDIETGSSPDFITVTSTLEVGNAARSDAGTYMCNASNTVFDTVWSDTKEYELTVNCKWLQFGCIPAAGAQLLACVTI